MTANGDETVRVEFEPPKTCRKVKASYWLEGRGEPDIQLPVSLTTLECEDTPDGTVVSAADVPRWLAEKSGLVTDMPLSHEVVASEEMTREDWYLLGLTIAMVVSGADDPVWNARKLADRLLEE